MSTEYEKCLAGVPFVGRKDPDLLRMIRRARKLLRQLNAVDYEDTKEKERLMRELIGRVDRGVHLEIDFHCELGTTSSSCPTCRSIRDALDASLRAPRRRRDRRRRSLPHHCAPHQNRRRRLDRRRRYPASGRDDRAQQHHRRGKRRDAFDSARLHCGGESLPGDPKALRLTVARASRNSASLSKPFPSVFEKRSERRPRKSLRPGHNREPYFAGVLFQVAGRPNHFSWILS